MKNFLVILIDWLAVAQGFAIADYILLHDFGHAIFIDIGFSLAILAGIVASYNDNEIID